MRGEMITMNFDISSSRDAYAPKWVPVTLTDSQLDLLEQFHTVEEVDACYFLLLGSFYKHEYATGNNFYTNDKHLLPKTVRDVYEGILFGESI